MTGYRIYILLFILCASSIVYSVLRDPHEFAEQECVICHIGPEYGMFDIKNNITPACETCHSEQSRTKSHPTDVYPTLPIPADLPLSQGKLTCLTCHYAHAKNVFPVSSRHYYLRRPERGAVFCSACHKIDHNRHIVFNNIHKGVYEETNPNARIDYMSLNCIECHDSFIKGIRTLGAGKWKHFSKKFDHPIGVLYKDVTRRFPNKFKPEPVLRKEIKLFNGKIGCGTCHNIYSREKAMLSISNAGGRLCLQCHRK